MKRPTFYEGVGVALAASLFGSVTYSALSVAVGGSVLRLVIAGLALGYVVYLLGRSGERVGRVTALVAWCAAAVALWLATPSLALYLLLHVGLIWLMRSLFFHASLLAALADLGLGGLALAAGVWAVVHSGSLLLGIWCFFLVQALFVAIPPSLARRPRGSGGGQEDGFERAHRVAEAAVRRLSSAG